MTKKQAGGANIPNYLLQWSPQHGFNEQAEQILFFNQKMFWLEIAKTRSIFVFLLKCSACFLQCSPGRFLGLEMRYCSRVSVQAAAPVLMDAVCSSAHGDGPCRVAGGGCEVMDAVPLGTGVGCAGRALQLLLPPGSSCSVPARHFQALSTQG